MKIKALRAAFPHTIPVLVGYLFVGVSYGLLMDSMGFSLATTAIMSILVYAGSMQFVAVNILLGAFDPLQALILTIMVNARHIFYGLSLLDKYKGLGLKKLYLIYALTDETFSVNCGVSTPQDVDRGDFMFFVSLLNHSYWVFGGVMGVALGALINFNTKGIEFVMTALFVVIFLGQWDETSNHIPAIIGIVASFFCLLIFGAASFLIPSMFAIIALLTVIKKKYNAQEVDA